MRAVRARLRLRARPAISRAAIEALARGVDDGRRDQVLLGVTGSGKTFTIANVIAALPAADARPGAQQDARRAALPGVPAALPAQRRRVLRLVLRLLPARGLRPAVATPTSRRKSTINEEIDRMRHSATRALFERRDVADRRQRVVHLRPGLARGVPRHDAAARARARARPRRRRCASWSRSSTSGPRRTCRRGAFRVRGDVVEIWPAYADDALRDRVLGRRRSRRLARSTRCAASDGRDARAPSGLSQLALRHAARDADCARWRRSAPSSTSALASSSAAGKLLEAQRLEQRTQFDLEMMARGRATATASRTTRAT